MNDYSALQNGSDIRGIAIEIEGGNPVNLNESACRNLASGYVRWLSEKCEKKPCNLVIAIGRDPRISGTQIEGWVISSINGFGTAVLDFGLATTPAMFMATKFSQIDADGAVMITASHLPMERNGLKFFDENGGLDSKDIKEIIEYAAEYDCQESENERSDDNCSLDLMEIYSAHLRGIICSGLGCKEEDKPLSDLHVVVDAGNGSGGFYAAKVLEPLGADCSGSQFLDPNGYFPNHIPNPENEEAMDSICSAVKENNADLGIIFDTDVDRSAAVGSDGREIGRNRIVGLAAYIASRIQPKTTIVTDSITSTQLGGFIEKDLRCSHLRFKRGYKNVINKGIELNQSGIDCQLAIETSGHAAMKENYFLDDGAYLATKIVIEAALLKKEGKHIEDLIASLEDPLEAKEVRFKVLADDFASYAQSVLDHIQKTVESGDIVGWDLELPNYEGVRVNVPGGWFLIRKSLHDPVIPLNIESDIEGGVEKTLLQIKELIKEFDQLA